MQSLFDSFEKRFFLFLRHVYYILIFMSPIMLQLIFELKLLTLPYLFALSEAALLSLAFFGSTVNGL